MFKYMKIMIIAASSLPIPAYRGGATETLVTQLLQSEVVKNEASLCIDVYSHCSGTDFKDGNISYYFCDITTREVLYRKMFRVIRLMLLRKININDNFPILLSQNVDLSQYDLIILEGNKDQVIPLRKVYNGKLALHIHTVMTLTKQTPFSSRIVKNCNYIYANSQFALRKMLEIKDVTKDKFFLWKNCIRLNDFLPTESFSKFRKWFRNKYNINSEEYVYIYCGRIEPGKGVLELIKAFKLLKTPGKLLIVGASWFNTNSKTSYVKRCEREANKIKDNIIFSGYIPHEEIAKYYYCADVAVMPSIYEESAGLVALEAQACGLPVIISNTGGIPEFISPRSKLKVGLEPDFITEMSDLMRRLYMDQEFYLYEKRLAMENIKNFDISMYADEFLRIIKSSDTTEN